MKRVLGIGAVIVALGAAAAAAVAITVVVVVRRRDPRMLRAFTRLQRDVLNPEVLKTAGERGQRTGVLETVGRRTGTPYRTPLSPVPDDQGWTVALVYGRETGWVRNALAAGEAVLQIDGRRHRVDGLEVIPVSQTVLAGEQARLMSFFRIEHAMRMRDAGVIDEDAVASAVAAD